MKISVIIPTYNRSQMLVRCLQALEHQTFPVNAFEVIVVNDGSLDQTTLAMESFIMDTSLDMHFFTQDNSGPSAARNLGISKSRGEYLAFTDDDCIPSPRWLEELLAGFPSDPLCAGSGGTIQRLRDNTLSRFIDEYIRFGHRSIDGKTLYLITANAIYRKEVIVAAGGFQNAFKWPGGEDPELSWRILNMGYWLNISDKALVMHDHCDTIRGIFGTMHNYGKGMNAGKQLGFAPSIKTPDEDLAKDLKDKVWLLFHRKNISFHTRFLYFFADMASFLGLYLGYKACPDITKKEKPTISTK